MSKMRRRKPKTYETTLNGKKTRVTIPENEDTDVLAEALKDNLSPEAVATIVAYLQPTRVKDAKVQREVEWFSGMLVELLGGYKAFNRLMDEVGL